MPTMGKVKFGLHFRGWQFQHGKQYAPRMGVLLVFTGDGFEAPPRVLPKHVGLALCPTSGIVFVAACVATASLLRIVATVHGLGLRCGLEVPLAAPLCVQNRPFTDTLLYPV